MCPTLSSTHKIFVWLNKSQILKFIGSLSLTPFVVIYECCSLNFSSIYACRLLIFAE